MIKFKKNFFGPNFFSIVNKSIKINSSGMYRVKKAFTNLDYNFIESWGNFISFDAAINELNIGAGSHGLDLNSG